MKLFPGLNEVNCWPSNSLKFFRQRSAEKVIFLIPLTVQNCRLILTETVQGISKLATLADLHGLLKNRQETAQWEEPFPMFSKTMSLDILSFI